MTLLEAITAGSQDDARAAIGVGDEVLVTLTSRRIPFQPKRATVTAASAKYVTVGGALKFHRTGKQVGERKSQPVHYGLYALTPEVEAALREAAQ
jgi:hypothetical protein